MLDYLILVFIILIGLGISSAIKAFKNVLSSSNSFYDKMNDEYQKANEESEDFNDSHTLVSIIKEAGSQQVKERRTKKNKEIDRADLESSIKSYTTQKRNRNIKRNSGYYRQKRLQQSNRPQLKPKELKPQELEPADNEAVVLDGHHLTKQSLKSSNPPVRGTVTDFDIDFEDLEMTADIVEPTKPMVTTKSSNKHKWREAMIYKEILGKPKALR